MDIADTFCTFIALCFSSICSLTAAYIICKVHQQNFAEQIPDYISILEQPDQFYKQHEYPGSPNNLHPVIKVKDTGNRKYNFTVCVSPMFNTVRGNEFVEFIEVNRMFGADHFVFYNFSADTSSSDSYIEYYTNKSILSLNPWTLPTNVQESVHYFAQLAAINDCVYKNMFLSKYVAIIDIDEFIVPLKVAKWSDLLKSIDQQKSKCYVFQCVFFRMEWPSHTLFQNHSIVNQYNIKTLLKTHRDTNAHPHGDRSKMILVPEAVNVVGIHSVQQFNDRGVKAADVNASDAILFHYRHWPKNELEEKETRMHDFANDFIDKKSTWIEACNRR